MTESTGRFASVPLSLLSKRIAVCWAASLPFTSHPKFVAGAFSQPCTSAASPAPVHAYGPFWPPMTAEPLGVATKSPPGVVQSSVLKNRWIHVASPAVGVAP